MWFIAALGLLIGTISAIYVRKRCGVSLRKKKHPFSLCERCEKWYLEIGLVHYIRCHGRCMDEVPFCWYELFLTILYLLLYRKCQEPYTFFLYALLVTLWCMMAYHDSLTMTVPRYELWCSGIMMALLGHQPISQIVLSFCITTIPLMVYRIFRPEQLGDGDLVMMGECCVFYPPQELYLTLLMACLFACVYLLVCMKKEASIPARFPFFPFLVSSMCIVLLA